MTETKELFEQGMKHLRASRHDEAFTVAKKLVTGARRNPLGHRLLGLVALETRQPGLAIEAFKSLVSLGGAKAEHWVLLARAFAQGGQADNARIALDKADALIDDSATSAALMDMIGVVYTVLDDPDSAFSWHQRAAERDGHWRYRLNRAKGAIFLGKLDLAREDLQAVLDQQQHHAEALWLLAGLVKSGPHDQIARIDNAIAAESAAQPLAYLHYAKGKLLEEAGDWDAAFDAFRAGAQAKSTVTPYDAVGDQAFFAVLEAIDWPIVPDRANSSDEQSIFIIGLPRVGSTLLERLLGSHSAVREGGEMPFGPRVLKQMAGLTLPGPGNAQLARSVAHGNPWTWAKAYLQAVHQRYGEAETRFITDKLPNNFFYAPFYAAALPGARFIHITRHPLDAILSSYRQLFADAYPHSYDLMALAEHYIAYHRLMMRYRTVMGNSLFEVAYEDLVDSPSTALQPVMAYLGLEFEAGQLDFHKAAAPTTTASAVQVRTPAHQRAVARYKRYSRQLAPVAEKLERAGIPL